MSIGKTIAAFAIAAVTIAATAGAASAVDAYAKSGVNVRSGPGTNFNKVDTLYAGEQVNVTECQAGWCYVEHSGPDGWVSGSYLVGSEPDDADEPAYGGGSGGGSNKPDVNCGFTIGPSGPSFGCSTGDYNPAPPPPTYVGKVCFYEHVNYNGNSFCVNAGKSASYVGNYWNNRISSIRVFYGAKVKVCNFPNYNGQCYTFSNNKPNVGGFNDKTTSYQTW